MNRAETFKKRSMDPERAAEPARVSDLSSEFQGCAHYILGRSFFASSVSWRNSLFIPLMA
jgi:hypothetical protein